MKKITFLIFALFVSTCALSQNFEFGKVSKEEMDMKKYDKDTLANAVVLNEYGKSMISEIFKGNIRLVYEYHTKIKIFDHKGFSNGLVEIHLRNNDDNTLNEEIVNMAGVTSYKDENGVTKTVELDRKKVYVVRDHKYQTTVKFAMPDVQDGCVIEYQYFLSTPFLDNYRSWQFQTGIPKINSFYEVHIPCFWHYNIALKGPLKLTTSQTIVEKNCFPAGGNNCDCLAALYGMKNIPAFLIEDYMTAPKNFISTLNFDMVDYTSPYTGVKTKVGIEWKDIDLQLRDNQEFGAQLKKKDLLRPEMPDSVFRMTDVTARAKAIYKWAQRGFKWNKFIGVYTNNGVKKTAETRSGSVADINITLINALNEAGINAEAVLLSTRDHGLVNKLYPAIGYFNYVIVKVNIADKSYFLDATDPLLPFGVLPEKCLNDQGLAFGLDKPSYWVTLDTKQIKSNDYKLELTFEESGALNGILTHHAIGYEAYLKRKTIKSFNSLDEYAESFGENLNKIKVTKYHITTLDSLDKPVNEQYFVETSAKGGVNISEFILNPYLLDKIIFNPFKLAERTYPVDMGMPSENHYTIIIHLPDNYIVGNIPPSGEIALPDQSGKFSFAFKVDGSNLVISYTMLFNKAIYQPEEYAGLKDFFNKIIQTERTDILLKKKL